MALGRKKRDALRSDTLRQLESQLDAMKATRAERELARGVFRQLLNSPNRPPLGTINRRSISAVSRSRSRADVAPIKNEMA